MLFACATFVPRALRASSNEPNLDVDDCAAFARGQRQEHSGDYSSALMSYRESVERFARGACSENARRRIETLVDNSEGAFGPWSLLETARRTKDIERNGSALELLLLQSSTFPEGKVRGEARLLVGFAFERNESSRARAAEIFSMVADDTFAATTTRRQALRGAVRILAAEDPRRASAFLEKRATLASRDLVLDAQRLLHRWWVHRASLLVLALFALFSAVGIARGRIPLRRSGEAVRTAFLRSFAVGAVVALAGGLLVSLYERGHATPFFLLGMAVAAISFLARAWHLSGATTRRQTGVRGILSALTCLAASFLILEWLNVKYLEAFGC